jgi:hypothetical protein
VGVWVFGGLFTGSVPGTVRFVQFDGHGLSDVAISVCFDVDDERSAHGYLLAVRKLCKM